MCKIVGVVACIVVGIGEESTERYISVRYEYGAQDEVIILS